jgi:hypothetical protein
MPSDTSTNDTEWVREEIIAGMDTVGSFGLAADYVGMGGGYKCRHCEHFIPIKSLDDDTCPRCGNSGMIGTVIMGRQEVTAMYPEGWFDEDNECNVHTDTDREVNTDD